MNLPVFLQLISIVMRAAFICLLIQELTKMKYGLWFILVNRFRYLYSYSMASLSYSVPGMTISKPDESYNEGWKWLQENSEYTWFWVNFIFQIVLIFALFEQFSLNQIDKKSGLFFISSPMLSLSYAFAFHYLILKIERLKQKVKLLEHGHRAY